MSSKSGANVFKDNTLLSKRINAVVDTVFNKGQAAISVVCKWLETGTSKVSL